jgi:hypothetical protein
VCENLNDEPLLIVSSEINRLSKTHGGGSHYLGIFDGEGHCNLGSSDDWGNVELFFAEAVKIATLKYGNPRINCKEIGSSLA